jgi:general secretion pathway protein E
LFGEAFEGLASDIHLEPKRDHLLVRMRFDGILHDMYRLPAVIHPAMVSRIKTISRLDIAERRRPQDGRIKIANKDNEAEVRVSTVPVAFGEKVVMRLLDPEALFLDLRSMFFSPPDFDKWQDFTSRPHGIILVSGPTGSGKTTTLYSTLRLMATSEVNVTTIEDPIEMIHEEFNQIAVQPKVGITFGSIIRTILRQDPDIIMVGEMRDKETAENAVQAALTGHLVLSTLHTNDAPSSVTRLVELGLEPFLVTSTVIGVMAQRLVRRICPYCSEDFVLTERMALDLGFITDGDLSLKHGKGCDECRNTGYLGRLATVEVMPFSDNLKTMVLSGIKNAMELKAQARNEGMTTLRENALDLMLAGKTTIEEVLRVTAGD